MILFIILFIYGVFFFEVVEFRDVFIFCIVGGEVYFFGFENIYKVFLILYYIWFLNLGSKFLFCSKNYVYFIYYVFNDFRV